MISRERAAMIDLTKQLEDLKEDNRKAEDEMKSLREELETMQDKESENGSSSSKEELESPEMSGSGEKKKWTKKPKKNKKNVF